MFTVDVITLFPEVFAPFVGLSIIGRAVEAGHVDIRYHHLLDALEGKERADEEPFGGGPGMVLRIEPISRILDSILGEMKDSSGTSTPRASHATLSVTPGGTANYTTANYTIVVPTPAGKQFTQADAQRFVSLERLIIVCGHYEGIDERLGQLYSVEEYSLGDFVVSGGEIPALAIMDATVRIVEGVIRPESLDSESFTDGNGSLDHPAYTRPPSFRGVSVPEVLLSGDHAKIAAWRREQSRLRTAQRKKS